LSSSSVIFPYAVNPFDLCINFPLIWYYLKLFYVVSLFFSNYFLINSIFKTLFVKKTITQKTKNVVDFSKPNLYIGTNQYNEKFYIPEKGLYQNILVTGTIGSGKTSSIMYPISKQLIEYKAYSEKEKLGLLILDVKGNFYSQIKKYIFSSSRVNDLILVNLDGGFKYNPLDKPHLSPQVLANRLKNILLLFSKNNSDSYWLDKAEQVLANCILFCRLYNNGYVDFIELHKLVNSKEYFFNKVDYTRKLFLAGALSKKDVFNLHSVLNFFEEEFFKLDERVLSIIKSEITRITSTFISEYEVCTTFCPKREEITFSGFSETLEKGKIVVLNLNIAEYKNLSKIIATYLKLDFQTEILSQLSNKQNLRTSAFICDEYHEYVTASDADFFAQSREAKSINIVATQSYSSLLNTLKDQYAVKVIIQNLINKIWFRTDDLFTIEEAQKQIGREDKKKINRSISENAQETKFNYLTNSLQSKNSNISESITTCIQTDFIFDTNFFTQNLEVFSCLAFISDGSRILKPQKLYLTPYFKL